MVIGFFKLTRGASALISRVWKVRAESEGKFFRNVENGKVFFAFVLTALSRQVVAFICMRIRKTISFVVSVCPSAWNNSALNGRILIKLDI